MPAIFNSFIFKSAYEDSEDYKEWLDFLSKGGATEEWNRLKKNGKKDMLEIDDKDDLYTNLKEMLEDLLERTLQTGERILELIGEIKNV